MNDFRAGLTTLVVVAITVVGCADPPSVVTRKVAKKDRTLVAYVPRTDEVWFVKLSGPAAFVDPLEDDYREIVAGMTFGDDGDPSFELPAGWSKRPGAAMRHATYSKGGPMEVAITRLPADAPLDDEYIKLNVSRWLRELGQPSRDGGWRDESLKRDELEEMAIAGSDGFLFDLRGSIAPARTSMIVTADPYLDYEVPNGWTEKPGDSFRMAIFELPGGAEVTISSAGGAPTANINRWEGQLGLAASSQEALVEKMERLQVSESPGLLIRLDGEKTADPDVGPVPTTIVGVIAIDGETQYFIKLTGPTESVDEVEEQFREFLTTIDFG